jgi:exodeoxyribonuclease-5
MKDEDNHLLDNPHIFLDEIMRQEEDSEIIKLTMDIRAGKPLTTFKGKDVQVLNKSDLTTGMLLWADQVICATNATRIALNNQMRELQGKSGDPQEGDKVICLKNNWDIYSDGDNPLVNGTVGYIKNKYNTFVNIPGFISSDRKSKRLDLINAEFVSDTNENYGSINMDKQLFLTGESGLDYKTSYNMGRNWRFKTSIPEQFTYGYAITGWKSQGSEWNNVLVIEEGFPWNEEEHKKFLYTCATRAAKKLVIIKKD